MTPDPTTGRAPTEAERIKAMVTIAVKAEEVGLDVFASGEHHNPPFFSSSPTTMLGYLAARNRRLPTNDPVKIDEDYAMLQHLADGRAEPLKKIVAKGTRERRQIGVSGLDDLVETGPWQEASAH